MCVRVCVNPHGTGRKDYFTSKLKIFTMLHEMDCTYKIYI